MNINTNPLSSARPALAEPGAASSGTVAGRPAAAGNFSAQAPALDARVYAALALLDFLGPPALAAPRVNAGTISAAEVIDEAERRRKERQEAEIGADGKNVGEISFKPVEDAAKRYAADIGSAVVRWTQDNASTALSFGVQMLASAVKAVATGGASLAVDGPKLGTAMLAIASGIAAEAGINLDKVVGDVASVALQTLGVDKDSAEQWGRTIASFSGAALELTLAYTSGGSYKINPAKFGTLAQDFAKAVGAETATAAMIATTVTGLATVGLALAAGQQITSLASADGLIKSALGLARSLAGALTDGDANLPDLLKEGSAMYAQFQRLLADFQNDTGLQHFWADCGPLAEKLAQAALGALVGWVAPQSAMQA
jgi:hypothetical protein